MKCQVLCYAIFMGAAFSSLVASESDDRKEFSTFVYPFYENMPIVVQSGGIDDLHNREGVLGSKIEPIVLNENRDMCDLDEICVPCDGSEEEQVCDEEGNCCCCQPAGGDQDLSEVPPISGYAVGGSGTGGIGFGVFGGGFATGLGGASTSSTSSGGGTSTTTDPANTASQGAEPTAPSSRNQDVTAVAVPEPSTWVILGTLLLICTLVRVRSRSLQKK